MEVSPGTTAPALPPMSPASRRTGLAHRGQDQVDVPFQAHALNRDKPQNAVWCGQHRVLQADWSEADTDACADQLEE